MEVVPKSAFLNNRLLVYICIPLCLLAASYSYARFIVGMDYVVEYEGECDPTADSCFQYCEDEACEEVYYYTLIQKRASDVYATCGPDITDCVAANVCNPGEEGCVVTYCDQELLEPGEACAHFAVSTEEEEEAGEEFTTEEGEATEETP